VGPPVRWRLALIVCQRRMAVGRSESDQSSPVGEECRTLPSAPSHVAGGCHVVAWLSGNGGSPAASHVAWRVPTDAGQSLMDDSHEAAHCASASLLHKPGPSHLRHHPAVSGIAQSRPLIVARRTPNLEASDLMLHQRPGSEDSVSRTFVSTASARRVFGSGVHRWIARHVEWASKTVPKAVGRSPRSATATPRRGGSGVGGPVRSLVGRSSALRGASRGTGGGAREDVGAVGALFPRRMAGPGPYGE
jgi:hypothetical protein